MADHDARYLSLRAALDDPAYAGLDDAAAADLLNAPGDAVPGVIPQDELLMWGAETGATLKIVLAKQAAIAEAGKGAEADPQVLALGGICQTIEFLLAAGTMGLDVARPLNLQLLGALVAAGICTGAQADDLVARGSRPGPSAAALLFGHAVTAPDVAFARSLT